MVEQIKEYVSPAKSEVAVHESVCQSRKQSRERSRTGSPMYAKNDEQLVWKLRELKKREKELENTIDRLHERLAQLEGKDMSARERTSEEARRDAHIHSSLLQEIRELKLQVNYQKDLVQTINDEATQVKREVASLQGENEALLRKNEVLSVSLRNKQVEHANNQRVIDDLQLQVKGKTFDIKELKSLLEQEKEKNLQSVRKVEDEHRKKYDTLKSLVEQYRSQMQEYVKLSYTKQRIQNERQSVQSNSNIIKSKDVPSTVVEPVRKILAQREEPVPAESREKIAQSDILYLSNKSMCVQVTQVTPQVKQGDKPKGRKHYHSSIQRNQQDRVAEIFKEGEDKENNSPYKNKDTITEYKRSICLSAERSLSQSRIPTAVPASQPPIKRPATSMSYQHIVLPSYKKLELRSQEVADLEAQLVSLSQRRDCLFAEYDKLPANKVRTMRAKARQEELERDITCMSQEISGLKIKLRDYNRE